MLNPKPQLPEELLRPTRMPLLGKLVTWTIGGVTLRRDDLVRICHEAGLDTQALPREIQTRSCVVRTLDRLEGDGFVRRIVEESDRAVFLLVNESIDRDQEAAHYAITRRFTYLKRERQVVCDDATTQAAVDALMAYFADVYLPADVRGFVLDVVKRAGALTLRDRGGVYFIPEPQLPVVDALTRFFEALGPGCSLLALNLPRTSSDVAGMLTVFESETLGELDALARELTELELDPTRIRPSTWRKRLAAFHAQRGKVELYASLLETESLRFMKRLNELEARVHAHLVG